MKTPTFVKIFATTIFIAALGGCSHPTPKTADGSATDPADMGYDPTNEKMGPGGDIEEGPRPDSKPLFDNRFGVVHFDFDSAVIRSEDRPTLEIIAKWMKESPSRKLQIAGNCDERGTVEYNLALGQRRATAARNYLVKLGADAENISTVSWGEEKPASDGHNEAAWAENRRDEFGIIE